MSDTSQSQSEGSKKSSTKRSFPSNKKWKTSSIWKAAEGSPTLRKTSDFDLEAVYYEPTTSWPKLDRQELVCNTDINLRRRPAVNMTLGFAIRATQAAMKKPASHSKVCSSITTYEALDAMMVEFRMLVDGTHNTRQKKVPLTGLLTRWRLVRNVLVDALGADWPSYQTAVEETGWRGRKYGPYSKTLHKGDRGGYANKGKERKQVEEV